MITGGFRTRFDEAEWRASFKKLEGDAYWKALLALEQVGWETMALLRGYVGETVPPVRPGEDPRQMHPGGWGDITNVLVNSYRFELYDAGRRVRWIPEPTNPEGDRVELQAMGTIPRTPRGPVKLDIINGAEYAAALESHDGYYVLGGITDPGGPVERAVKLAARAMGMEII